MKQRSFNCGQLYVSLSRLESLSGLYVSGDISNDAICPDEKALCEYDRLRKEAIISPILKFDISPSTFVFCQLNTRSFKSHFDDIQSDHVLTECDLMLFTETRIGECASCPNDKLNDFKIYFHNDSDSFKSLAVCYRETVNFEFLDCLPGMIAFSVSKHTFSSETLKFILLYRKNLLSNIEFAYMIDYMLSRYPDIDIIAGDFNEDGFNMPGNLSSINFLYLFFRPNCDGYTYH